MACLLGFRFRCSLTGLVIVTMTLLATLLLAVFILVAFVPVIGLLLLVLARARKLAFRVLWIAPLLVAHNNHLLS